MYNLLEKCRKELSEKLLKIRLKKIDPSSIKIAMVWKPMCFQTTYHNTTTTFCGHRERV